MALEHDDHRQWPDPRTPRFHHAITDGLFNSMALTIGVRLFQPYLLRGRSHIRQRQGQRQGQRQEQRCRGGTG